MIFSNGFQLVTNKIARASFIDEIVTVEMSFALVFGRSFGLFLLVVVLAFSSCCFTGGFGCVVPSIEQRRGFGIPLGLGTGFDFERR